jgi:hypothetical protein
MTPLTGNSAAAGLPAELASDISKQRSRGSGAALGWIGPIRRSVDFSLT